MDANLIFIPLIVMVFITFLTLIKVGKARVRGVKEGRIDPKMYKTNQFVDYPGPVAQLERHYNNLLEMPILFYLWVVVLYITENVDSVGIGLAWAYVILRTIHSYIHLGDNVILHRRKAFVFSVYTLIIGWMWMVYKLFLVSYF